MDNKPFVHISRWLLILWTGGMLYLFFNTNNPDLGIEWFEGQDKVAHFGLFGIWSALVYVGFSNYFQKPIWWVLILAIGFALATELAQYYIPGRSSDWLDAGADLLGSLIAVFTVHFLKKELIRMGKQFY